MTNLSQLLAPYRVHFNRLSTMSYAQGTTQWHYKVPLGHYPSHLADPSYWADATNIIHEGDWLFAIHTAPQGTYNAIYCFTSGPSGLWAQSLLSSAPPIGVNPNA